MILQKLWMMIRKVIRLLPGFLLFASFPPLGEGVDCLFALAPLLYLARQGDVRESVKDFFANGLLFWLLTLSWMPAIIKNNGPWPLVILGWFALAAYMALYFAAFAYLSASYWSRAKSTGLRLFGVLFVEPVLWCGLELVRSTAFGGFAWNHLGVVPANCGFALPASIGGVYLLSAVVVLINGSLVGIAERVVARVRAARNLSYDPSALSRLCSLETLAVFALIFVIYRLPTLPMNECATPLKVALVQRNFPCCFQTTTVDPVPVYSNLLASVSCLKPDLVVLSESAMSEFGVVDGIRAHQFADEVRRMTGARGVLAGGGRVAAGMMYNSAALYQAESTRIYDKVHLVPFGEYIPCDKLFPILQRLAPVGSCMPGTAKLLAFDDLSLGAAICYEDTDSALIRTFARQGAQLLCFITNDSWFSHSTEAYAHAWQATARAVETGLPVVRVGNSGVTGVILPDGKASWLRDADGKVLVDRRSTMMDRVFVPTKERVARMTPYVRYGDMPLWILFTLLTGGLILVKYKGKRKKTKIHYE